MAHDTLSAPEWVAIIGAIFVGLTSLLTATVSGIVLVLQVLNKKDMDGRLEKIDANVNGNLHLVNTQLSTALDALNVLPQAEAAALDAMVENHRELHRPPGSQAAPR